MNTLPNKISRFNTFLINMEWISITKNKIYNSIAAILSTQIESRFLTKLLRSCDNHHVEN